MRTSLVAAVVFVSLAPALDAQQGSSEPLDVSALITAIESPQEGADPDGLGAMGIDELMAALGVPGVSVAVIHDFEVHWAKGYGIADVETG
jgi:CubicO group peptidase (beta-lactamase class C family)